MTLRKFGVASNIFSHFSVYDNAGCHFMLFNKGTDECDGWLFLLEIRCQRSSIKQVAFHRSSSRGGVGVLSWRILSSSLSISSQERSLHAPARCNAVCVASSDTALSAWVSSEKYRTTSFPFSSKGMPISGWFPESVKPETVGNGASVI